MQDRSGFENILPEIELARKLNAYKGVKARNNRLVLGYLASQGPSLPYKIFKDLKDLGYFKDKQYPTIYRRVKSLVKEGYVTQAGTRSTLRGKQSEETRYGLTSLGLIASLALESIRQDVIHAFEHHLNTIVPTNARIADVEVEAQRLAQGILSFVGKIYTGEEIYAMITALFLGYLKSSAPPLDELIYSSIEGWVPWIKSIISNAAHEQKRLLPQGIEKTTNLYQLLDEPDILDLVKVVLPVIMTYSSNQIRTYYHWLLAANGLRETFDGLTPEDRPSKRAEDFLANKLPNLIQQFENSIREYEENEE